MSTRIFESQAGCGVILCNARLSRVVCKTLGITGPSHSMPAASSIVTVTIKTPSLIPKALPKGQHCPHGEFVLICLFLQTMSHQRADELVLSVSVFPEPRRSWVHDGCSVNTDCSSSWGHAHIPSANPRGHLQMDMPAAS